VLATGGSGDVLSGLCGALAVGRALDRAAALAAHIHGDAARRWASAHGGADRGLLAREILDHVPAALAALLGP
jgi:NAD(P)H-hydrate repair Nnr-like enzyme with NAD(P)H-hydrate dehydratase domain